MQRSLFIMSGFSADQKQGALRAGGAVKHLSESGLPQVGSFPKRQLRTVHMDKIRIGNVFVHRAADAPMLLAHVHFLLRTGVIVAQQKQSARL